MVDIADVGNANLTEVAHFDTYPSHNNTGIQGAWSNYPFFDSGHVIVSDITGGLFILDPLLCPVTAPPMDLLAQATGDNSISLSWNDDLSQGESYVVYRSEGGCAADDFIKIADHITEEQFTDLGASGLVDIGYKVAKVNADGVCESTRSSCSETQTTGICTAAPVFSGIQAVSSNNANTCGLNVQWGTASSQCGSIVNYNIYKSLDETVEPVVENLVATGIDTQNWVDNDVIYDQYYHYMVRAVDVSNTNEENNLVTQFNKPEGELANGTWSSGAEVGDTGLSQNTRHVGWELVTDTVFAGERSYWSQDNNDACNRLTSDPISLTAGEVSELSFQTLYDIEDRWDGGVIEISVDQGPWMMPPLMPGYPNTFNDSDDFCNYAENTPAFSGSINSWQEHTVDLAAYEGQEIQVQFSYSTDETVNDSGWFIDEVAVSNAQVPGVCATVGSDLIFLDGFE